MATVTRASAPSLDLSTGMVALQLPGLVAGEDLSAGAACYLKTADGKVYQSNGTAANEAAEFAGFCPAETKAGEAVTLFSLGARFYYGSGLGAGDKYFVDTTAGRLSTVATTGGLTPVAMAVSDTDIVVIVAAA